MDILELVNFLTPDYFRETIKRNNSTIVLSDFSDNFHNFVIPDNGFTKKDFLAISKSLFGVLKPNQEFSFYLTSNEQQLFFNSLGFIYDAK